MSKILSCLVILLFSFSAMAKNHGSVKAEVMDAAEAFPNCHGTRILDGIL